jgi:hypothetical protein
VQLAADRLGSAPSHWRLSACTGCVERLFLLLSLWFQFTLFTRADYRQ